MSAYLIIKARLTDRENFQAYANAVPEVVKAFGGVYIAIDSSPEVFEGEPEIGSVVISKWPSKQAGQDFWNSDEYKKIVPLRAGTGDFHVMLVEGV